jgi:hypothetical protein
MSVGAIHATHFNQPWQTVLLLSDTASPPGGAFFLKDSTNSRWFYAPFYELAEQAIAGNAPKTTCVSWQQYITADAVVLGVTEPLTPPPSMVATAKAAGRRTPADHSVSLDSSHYLARRERLAPADQPGTARSRSGDRVESDELASQETSLIFDSDEPSKGVDRAVPSGPSGPSGHRLGLADVAPQSADELPERVERRVGFIEKASRKKSTVDDRNQPRGSRSKVRLATDNEDTAAGDQPSRYIDLARAEGFFVAAKFDTQDESGNAETVWVLNEPYSGFLLTVASTSTEVVDASLHYNLRTDDAGLGRTPFPEHRDRDSHTIYMRETCLHSLRARCRRLRDTSSLVREWKVSPAMSFISPGEWQSIALASADDARHTVSTLNSTRAAELPEGVRAQFGIAAPGNRPA